MAVLALRTANSSDNGFTIQDCADSCSSYIASTDNGRIITLRDLEYSNKKLFAEINKVIDEKLEQSKKLNKGFRYLYKGECE